MKYREYKEGDTIRVTGCQGRLFSGCGNTELNNGVKLGVECVLVEGEDAEHDVKLPKGILFDDDVYISVACIELVQAVEDKPKEAILEHIDSGERCRLYRVSTSDGVYEIAKIWYDNLPQDVAEKFAEAIKAAYDSIVINRKKKHTTVCSVQITNL